MTIRKLALASLISGALGVFAAPASASLMLTFSDGVNTLSIADGDAGDFNLSANRIRVLTTFGDWDVEGTGGRSLYNPTGLHLDAFQATYTGFGTGTLVVTLSEDGLTIPSLVNTSVTTSVGGSTSETTGNLTFTTKVNGAQVSTLGPYNPASEDFGGHITVGGIDTTTPGGFTLSQVASITHTGAGDTSFDMRTTVPEPVTVGLLGLGLLGFGVARRRKAA